MKKVLVVLTTLLLAPQLFADDFYPIASVASSTSASDLFPAANLIQGPGVGFDAAAPYNRLLGGAEGTWVTAAPGGFPSDFIAVAGAPVITLDLGADRALSEISAWGYSDTNANGVSQFSLRFASQADGPGGFGSTISYNPSFPLANSQLIRQSNLFNQVVTARYVEFTASDNFFVAPGDGSGGATAGGDRVGLGEIAFMVPEPSSLVLLLAGGLLLLARRR